MKLDPRLRGDERFEHGEEAGLIGTEKPPLRVISDGLKGG
jgi:hypothetical protein